MKTVIEQIEALQALFRSLSARRRSKLARDAREYISRQPHMADSNGFWRGLSARHVIAANVK